MRSTHRLALLALCLPTLATASQVVLDFNNEAKYQSLVSVDIELQLQIDRELLSLHTKPRACASCQSVIAPLKSLAHLGDDRFVGTLIRVCKYRKFAEPEQCEGDLSAQGPILAHDFRNIAVNGISAARLCNAIFGICEQPPVTSYEVKFPKPLPNHDERKKRKRRKARRPPFQVVHISDVHIDREYTVGAEANCDKWICCRNYDNDFTEMQPSKGNESVPAGPYGNFRCDTPIPLAHSMLDAVRTLVPNAQFTISTGDVIDHANWLVTKDTVTEGLHEFHTMLKRNLTSTFYGSLGNHDSYPTNAFVREGSNTDQSTDWVFELIGNDWKRWIGKEAVRAIRHHSGSYAVVHPGTNLKIISLNTLYWYKYNLWIYDSDAFIPDPNSIFSFIIDELQAAEDAGQRAWLFGHIPPGVSDWMLDQSNYYNQIVSRYRDVIAGQFFGHTHHDSFQVAYSDYKNRTAENAISFGLIAPSLTPTNGNPAFTVYDVDPDSYEIMDRKIYYANLTAPGYQTQPTWHLLYSTVESYSPFLPTPSNADEFTHTHTKHVKSPLTPSFWHNLASAFLSNDTLFTTHRNRMVRDAWDVPCGRERVGKDYEECKQRAVCGLMAMRSEDNCDTPGGVLPWIDAREEHRCDGSMLPTIMRKLLGA